MIYGYTPYGSTSYGAVYKIKRQIPDPTSIQYSGVYAVVGTKPEPSPSVVVTETPINGSTSSATVVIDDINVTRTTTTPTTNNCKLNVIRISDDQSHDFVSTTPSICSVDSDGNITRISSGAGKVAIYTPFHIIGFSRTFSNNATVVSDEFLSWTTGSLGAHIDAAIRTMISGRTAGASTQAVLSSTSGGAASPNHVRNANLFTGTLDLSAISVYGTAYDSNKFPVVLISPLHVMAGHAGASPGQQIVFKASNGTYEVRTVVSQVIVANDWGENYVGLLNSEITTITPMKMLPTTWEQYLPNLTQDSLLSRLPVLNKGWTAGDFIRILNADRAYYWHANLPYSLGLRASTDVEFQSWSSDIVGGDSNGPVFIPINGEPVLLHCMNFTNGGAFYPSSSAAIQAAMTSLATGTLSYADLSLFPTY